MALEHAVCMCTLHNSNVSNNRLANKDILKSIKKLLVHVGS